MDNNNENPQPSTTKNEKPKEKYFTQLKWRDWTNSLNHLENYFSGSHQNVKHEDRTHHQQVVNQSLDIFFHGCDSIAFNSEIEDKVLTLDVKLENLFSYVKLRPRFLSRALTLLCVMLKQDELSIGSKTLQLSAITLLHVFKTYGDPSNNTLPYSLQLSHYFYSDALAGLQYALKLSAIGDHIKLNLCTAIEIIEAYEQTVLQNLKALSTDDKIVNIIHNTSSRDQDHVQLYGKILLLKQAKREEWFLASCSLFHTTLSVDVCNAILNFLIAASDAGNENPLKILESLYEMSQQWKQSRNQSNFVCKFLLLSQGLILLRGEGAVTHVMAESLPNVLHQFQDVLENPTPQATGSKYVGRLLVASEKEDLICNWSALFLELLNYVYDKEFDEQLILDNFLPAAVACAKQYKDITQRDTILQKSIEFGIVTCVMNMKEGAHFLITEGYTSMTKGFFTKCIGFNIGFDFRIMNRLHDLCIQFVKTNIEAKSFKDFLEFSLPKSLFEIAQWEVTDEEKIELLEQILIMGLLAVSIGMNRYKAMIFYLPTLYTLISLNFSLSGTEKKQTIIDIVGILITALSRGQDISTLLSDGFPSILEIFDDSEFEDLRKVNDFLVTKFETNGEFSILLSLKFAFDFFKANFERQLCKNLFRTLVRKGKREQIKLIFQTCKPELNHPRYARLRKFFLGDPEVRQISSREFDSLCNILRQAVMINLKSPHPTISKMTEYIVQQVENDLVNNNFTKKQISVHEDALSRVALFKQLFAEELDSLQELTIDGISQVFERKFPEDVLQDPQTMETLTTLGRRLENLQPKFKHVQTAAVQCINELLTVKIPTEITQQPQKIKYRITHLNQYIHNLPKNIEFREHLISVGYSPEFWNRDLYVQLEASDSKNIEDNFKNALKGCYGEYVDILQQLQVKKVELAGASVEVDKLFAGDDLNIKDLKLRKTIATEMIDALVVNHLRKDYFLNRKLALLAQETRLERQFKEERELQFLADAKNFDPTLEGSEGGKKTKMYWARITNTFMNSVSSCGNNIVGCYAPDGDHCEKPAEIGMKNNQAMISVFEHNEQTGFIGTEIENVEVLLTDQGMFVFKLYTNGHPYDTSIVWLTLFKSLIEQQYVPAIIIPKNFPNTRTFDLLRQFISEEYSSSTITYRDDFFMTHGVDSYYDLKPNKIGEGDILITEENISQIKLPVDGMVSCELELIVTETNQMLRFSTELTKTSKAKKSRTVKPIKDLVGQIVTNVILQTSQASPNGEPVLDTQKANVLGRFISQYVTKLVNQGQKEKAILTVGFDLQQWNTRKKNDKMTPEQKSILIDKVINTVHHQFDLLYEEDPAAIFGRNRSHLFELKGHIEQVLSAFKKQHDLPAPDPPKLSERDQAKQVSEPQIQPRNQQEIANLKKSLARIKVMLEERAHMTIISNFEVSTAEDIMRWIFLNEDKVWKDRGGRPEEETVRAFMNWVQPSQPSMLCHKFKTNVQVQAEDVPLPDELGYRKDHFGYDAVAGVVVYGDLPNLGLEETTLAHPASIASRQNGVLAPETKYPRLTMPRFFAQLHSNAPIVAYTIGDFISYDTFEIATAWVDTRYKGMAISIKMYIRMMKELHERGCKFFVFDVIDGGLFHIVEASSLFFWLVLLGIDKKIFVRRKESWKADRSDGKVEQFEQFVMNLDLFIPCMKLFEKMIRWTSLVNKKMDANYFHFLNTSPLKKTYWNVYNPAQQPSSSSPQQSQYETSLHNLYIVEQATKDRFYRVLQERKKCTYPSSDYMKQEPMSLTKKMVVAGAVTVSGCATLAILHRTGKVDAVKLYGTILEAVKKAVAGFTCR